MAHVIVFGIIVVDAIETCFSDVSLTISCEIFVCKDAFEISSRFSLTVITLIKAERLGKSPKTCLFDVVTFERLQYMSAGLWVVDKWVSLGSVDELEVPCAWLAKYRFRGHDGSPKVGEAVLHKPSVVLLNHHHLGPYTAPNTPFLTIPRDIGLH